MTKAWGYELFGQRQFRQRLDRQPGLQPRPGDAEPGRRLNHDLADRRSGPVSMVQTMSRACRSSCSPFRWASRPTRWAIAHDDRLPDLDARHDGDARVVALPGGRPPRSGCWSWCSWSDRVVVQQSSWKPFLYEVGAERQGVGALAFNSLSSDIGRAAGPALGGSLMGFFRNPRGALHQCGFTLFMITVLRSSRVDAPPVPAKPTGPGAPVAHCQAWNLVRESPRLYGPVIRHRRGHGHRRSVVGPAASEAKENIQTGPIGYGGLLAALAIGAAAGRCSHRFCGATFA